MALERLLASLAREADDEAEAVVRGACVRRARALADAESAAATRRARWLAEREQELTAAATVAVESARRATLQRELEARASLLARLFARAAEHLPRRIEAEAVRRLLARLVSEALASHGGEGALVRSSPGLAEVVAERCGARGGATVAGDAGVGTGAVIVLEGGSLEIDVTLESQLARMRPRLAAAALRALAKAPS